MMATMHQSAPPYSLKGIQTTAEDKATIHVAVTLDMHVHLSVSTDPEHKV